MSSEGYKSQPLSDELEQRIQDRLRLEKEESLRLKRTSRSLRDYLEAVTDARIATLEWVLQEADVVKESK